MGLFFSALFFAGSYYSIGRFVAPHRRALVAGPLAALASVAFVLFKNPDLSPEVIADWRAIAALSAWFLGIAFWTWRTHRADLRSIATERAD